MVGCPGVQRVFFRGGGALIFAGNAAVVVVVVSGASGPSTETAAVKVCIN